MAKHYGLDAAGETADVKRGDLAYFYPEDLIPNDKNYRFGSFDSDPAVKAARELEIEAMVQSLCAERQKQPVSIHQVPGNRFKVHAGDTRHQAFLRINERGIWPHGKPEEGGRARIECRVENFAKDAEREIFGSSIVENLSRHNLTVIDMAIAVSQATNLGYSDTEIMAKFHQKDPAFLPNMRRLAVLPDQRKRQIHLGQMAAQIGYLLAEIPESEHAAVIADAMGEPSSTETEQPNVLSETLADPPAPAVAPILGRVSTARATSAKKKPKKLTARAVAESAKKMGLLKHKKIAWTPAGMREFFQPLTQDTKGAPMTRLADSFMARLEGDTDDDKFYKDLIAIFKSEANQNTF